MKILFDHCVDRRLRRYLPSHEVKTTYEMGWAAYKNGALLAAAEEEGFEVFLTVDQNLQHQQNMTGRRIMVLILVVKSNRLDDLVPLVPHAEPVLQVIQAGQIIMVEIPTEPEVPS